MDTKYAYYSTSKGYRVVGGTAAHFLKADGSLDNNSYALVNLTVPYTGATSDLTLADKNLNFTTGSVSRVEGNTRIFNKVFQNYVNISQTGILSFKFPQATTAATMFDVTLKIYGYQNRFLGNIRVSFYKNNATSINGSGHKAVIECSDNFPTTALNVGIDANGNVRINIGESTTVWSTYLTVEVERVSASHSGYNFDWSKGWSQTIEDDVSTYQSLLNIIPDIVATRSFIQNQNYFQANNIIGQPVNSTTVATLDSYLPNGGVISGYGTAGWGGSDAPSWASYGGFIKFNDNNGLQLYYNNGHNSSTNHRLGFRTKNTSNGTTVWYEFATREWSSTVNIPYTGATNDIHLNGKKLNGTNSINITQNNAGLYGSYVGLESKSSDGNTIYLGGVADSVGSYVGQSRYISSNLYQSNKTYSSFIKFGNVGDIYFYGNTGLTANTNYSPTELAKIDSAGRFVAQAIVKASGVATQFLKADGSVDSNTYSLSSHTHTFSSLTAKPTTASGYGITDVPRQGILGGDINSIRSNDTRNTNPLPSTDLKSGAWFDFKGVSTIGLISSSNWASVMTFVPYTDDSGNSNSAYRLAQSGDELSFQNYTPSGWSAWRKIWTNKHFSQTEINNWNTAFGWGNHTTAGYIPLTQKGSANGVATLDASGLIPSTQLPSYVDDVIEASNLAALNAFPANEKQTGKIYITTDTNKSYRWSGSVFVEISSGAVQSVNGQTGVVNLTYSDVGASPVNHIHTIAQVTGLQSALDGKVDDAQVLTNVPAGALFTDTIYTLPTATSTVKGGIETFSDTVQSVASNSVTNTANRTYGIQLNSAGQAVVNVPWSNDNTTYTAGNGLTLSGTVFSLPVTISGSGNYITDVTQNTNGITVTKGSLPSYTLLVATSNSLGGVRLITDTVNNVTPNAATTTVGRSYAVQLNNSNQAIVNVPWTDNNTTYTSSNGIVLTGTNFAPTFGTTANTIAQGNDSRINNGQTAFGWDNHAIMGYAKLASAQTFTGTNTFSVSPMIPNATLPVHPVNLGQLSGILSGSYVSQVYLENNFVKTPDGYAVLLSSSTNLNDNLKTGFYRGEQLVNAPNSNTGWWFIAVESHDPNWRTQKAISYGVGNVSNLIYQRTMNNGVWSPWSQIWSTQDFTVNNIQQWNYAYQYGLKLNEEFTTHLNTGLIIADNYFGGESGIIDRQEKRLLAAKNKEYYFYGSQHGNYDGLNFNFETRLFGMGRVANKNDKLTVEGSVKASKNFKSEDERPDTLFIPNGETATLRDEIINDESEYAIRLDPHEYEIDPSGYLEVDDRNRLIHVIGEQIKMVVNFRKIYPKQQIVIYNFDQNGGTMAVKIQGKTIASLSARCFLRLYVTKSSRVIAERQQPCDFVW